MSTTEFFTAQPPLVSFVVPTLNRGKYVLRAVRSCLNNDDKNVCIEVVVIDSSSKDGSYEDLQKEFSDDIRVKLLQNPSGSGPIKSWLEGVESISGYSGHANQVNLLRFIKGIRKKPSLIRLVHGEPYAQEALQEEIGAAFPEITVESGR